MNNTYLNTATFVYIPTISDTWKNARLTFTVSWETTHFLAKGNAEWQAWGIFEEDTTDEKLKMIGDCCKLSEISIECSDGRHIYVY